ncbi:unnamed protein product [Peniophora sp. CBMAI 1063]|nr:unnamed protein product [Peniophora sp. CBMAI 1063]
MQSPPPAQPTPRYASSKTHPLLQPTINRPLAIPIPGRATMATPFNPSPRFEYPFPSPPGAHAQALAFPFYAQPGADYQPAVAALTSPFGAYPTGTNVVLRTHPASSAPARPHSASKRALLTQPSPPPMPPSLAKRLGASAQARSSAANTEGTR